MADGLVAQVIAAPRKTCTFRRDVEMAAKPDFTRIEKSMQAGEDFSLTRAQYLTSTGKALPKEKYYTERKSAIAKCAKAHGYRVEVVPEIIRFVKVR